MGAGFSSYNFYPPLSYQLNLTELVNFSSEDFFPCFRSIPKLPEHHRRELRTIADNIRRTPAPKNLAIVDNRSNLTLNVKTITTKLQSTKIILENFTT